MKSDHIKRLFAAIAKDDLIAIRGLAIKIILAERQKGHTTLAGHLEEILENAQPDGPADGKDHNRLLKCIIPREQLRHQMVLPCGPEWRLRQIEQEYVARDRLSYSGLMFQQKILLYGPSGCGKSMGAERLAWNVGLPFVRVRFDTMIALGSRDAAINIRQALDLARSYPWLLFFDECDLITQIGKNPREMGEVQFAVRTFLQMLEEYHSTSALLVAAINTDEDLSPAQWKGFDTFIHIPKPGMTELEEIVKHSLGAMLAEPIDAGIASILLQRHCSASEAVSLTCDAVKRSILEENELITQEFLEEAISMIDYEDPRSQ